MILAFDVGGTKIEAGAFRCVGVEGVPALLPLEGAGSNRVTKSFSSGDVSDFADVVASIVPRAADANAVEAIALAVAGPIDRNRGRVQLTNLPWGIDFADLSRQFSNVPVIAFNDLEALAWATLCLQPGDGVTLQRGQEGGHHGGLHGNRAVIAAGTGLGEALVVWDGKDYLPVATEGGHAGFAPTTDDDAGILKLARRHYGDHVSWERVVSGAFGMPLLLEFYSDGGKLLTSDWACPKSFTAKENFDWGGLITARAESGDSIAVKVLRRFCWLYGSEAGNLALKCMGTGGVFVGGGIAPKILKWLQGGDFLAGFLAKGRFAELMSEIPVTVLTASALTLRGAAFGASRTVRGE